MRLTIKLIDGSLVEVSGFHCDNDNSIDNLISRGAALRFEKRWGGADREYISPIIIPAHSVLWIKEAKQND